MRDQRALDLKGRDPDAGHLEHVVGAAAKRVTAVGIANILVTGAGPVALKGVPALGALIPVAFSGRWRLDQQFADFAVRHVSAIITDQPDLVAGHGTAGCAVLDVIR